MKPMNENNNNNNNHSNTNWLGFSFSNQMNMEPNHSQPTSSSSSPLPSSVESSFFLSPYFNDPAAIFYGGENAGFYTNQLSVMPLNSDGSLCLMEALTRSHQKGMVASQSPKLEDFVGCGPNMRTPDQFGNSGREAMALSLDSMFYTQNPETEHRRNHPELLRQPFNSQQLTYYQPLEEEEMLKNWASGFGDLDPLSLSMSPGTQSSCVTTVQNQVSGAECLPMDASKKRGGTGKGEKKQPVHRKSIETFGQRTSQYRGVTRHRWTGRYEAHLWDNSCKKEGQTRKGRQVYLGGYDMEDKAARAYDLAALKYWGTSSHINFPLDNYCSEIEEMKNMSRQEFVAHLRRKSSGFSRGASIYRGVTRHHQHGRWQARIGRVSGNKDLYLGTFSTQEEAAEAYDIAAIKFRGLNAVTNFDITKYDVEKIMASNTLLPIEHARRNKAIVVHNSNMELQLASDQLENNPFSTDHHVNGFLGIESASSVTAAQGFNDSDKAGSAHVSNSSSLVSSLNSSAEASPDRGGIPILYGKSPLLSSWIPIAHPVFAAWTNHD